MLTITMSVIATSVKRYLAPNCDSLMKAFPLSAALKSARCENGLLNSGSDGQADAASFFRIASEGKCSFRGCVN